MILRYPGGKKRQAKFLAPVLTPCREFREPFFGSGAVTFGVLGLPNCPERVWINDLDPGIASLWTAVIREPAALITAIEAFVPSVEAFKDFKESLLQNVPMSDVERGLQKLAVHQMSFSGLGTKAGSPIGGWTQGPENIKQYDVGCRWNPTTLVGHVSHLHGVLAGRVREGRCTAYDALDVINAPGDDVSIYADPPYVVAGESLYQYGYPEEALHRGLAAALLACPHRWLLSYDDDPRVRTLYEGAPGVAVDVATWAYTINSQKDNPGQELLIRRGIVKPAMPVAKPVKAGGGDEDVLDELFGSGAVFDPAGDGDDDALLAEFYRA